MARAAPSLRPAAASRRWARTRAHARSEGGRAAASDIWKNDNCVQSVATLRPLASSTALLSSSMIHCVATVIAKVSSGRITSGMLAFESTVVRSETGSDFQNRMLRSRRSPCSASRAVEHPDDKSGHHDQTRGEVVRLRDRFVLLRGVERRQRHASWPADESC